MNEPIASGKRLLQAAVGVLALIPVATGATGMLGGPAFLGVERPWPVDLDSHFRFLSAIFLAIGLGFYATIPDIERKTQMFRLCAAPIVAGGLARLGSLLVAGTPGWPHAAGIVMELGVVPALVFWQAKVARQARASGDGVGRPVSPAAARSETTDRPRSR